MREMGRARARRGHGRSGSRRALGSSGASERHRSLRAKTQRWVTFTLRGVLLLVLFCVACGGGNTGGKFTPDDDTGKVASALTSSCSFTVTKNVYDGSQWWGTISFENNGPSSSSNYQVEFDVPAGAHCTADAVPSGATLSPLAGTTSPDQTVSNHCIFAWTNASPLAAGATTTFNYSTDSQSFSSANNVDVSDSACNGGALTCNTFALSKNSYDGSQWWGTISFKNNGPTSSSNYQAQFDVPSGAHCTADAVPSGATLSPLSGTTHPDKTVSNHCVFTWANMAPLAAGASFTFNYSTDSQSFSSASNVTARDTLCSGALSCVMPSAVPALPQWTAGTSYVLGQQVQYQGQPFQCMQPSCVAQTSVPPGGTGSLSTWTGVEECGIEPWAPGVAYSVGAIVVYGGQLYHCTTPNTSSPGSPPNADPSQWQSFNPAAGAPGASGDPTQVTPVLDCVASGPGVYTGVFGYKNTSSSPVVVPIGSNNKFTGGAAGSPPGRGQPIDFASGTQDGAFVVDFDGTALTWQLGGHSVTASSSSTACTTTQGPDGPVVNFGGTPILLHPNPLQSFPAASFPPRRSRRQALP